MKSRPAHGGTPPRKGWIDFSSNLHPLPAPPELVRVVQESISDAGKYPEADAGDIRRLISEKHGISAGQIAVGPGSSTLLYHIVSVLKPVRTYVPVPCFSEYKHVAAMAGSSVTECPVEKVCGSFSGIGDPPSMPEGSMVIMSDPCNPTGIQSSLAAVEKWADKVRDINGILMIDEAYADFRAGGPHDGILRLVNTHPVIVLRSPLKFYTLPGLRAGVAFLPNICADRIVDFVPPWPLAAPSLSALRFVMDIDGEQVAARRDTALSWGSNLRGAIQSVRNLMVHPSDVHFGLVSIQMGNYDAYRLADDLSQDGLWIRTPAGMPGLSSRDFRISPRCPEDNERLIEALKKRMAVAPGDDRV